MSLATILKSSKSQQVISKMQSEGKLTYANISSIHNSNYANSANKIISESRRQQKQSWYGINQMESTTREVYDLFPRKK